MAFNPRGFVPYKHLNGCVSSATKRYRTYGANALPIFVGDLIVMTSGGTSGTGGAPAVDRLAVADASATMGAILGVAQGLYDSNNKPLTFSQPTTGPYLKAATDGYVDVIIDPHVTYTAIIDGTASAMIVGRYIGVTATAVGTAAGISNMGLSTGVAVNLYNVPVSGVSMQISAAYPLYVVGIAQMEGSVDEDVYSSAVAETLGGAALEVMIANNIFTNPSPKAKIAV